MAPPAAAAAAGVDKTEEFTIQLPVHISQIGGRYLIFDVDVAMWLRKEHRMCGVTVGTLPQIPSQNVFLGLPVELMPEEAYFLAETGIALLVDEASVHRQALQRTNKNKRREYVETIQERSRKIEAAKLQEKETIKAVVLKKKRVSRDGRVKDSGHMNSATLSIDPSSQDSSTTKSDTLFDFDDTTSSPPDSTTTTKATNTSSSIHRDNVDETPLDSKQSPHSNTPQPESQHQSDPQTQTLTPPQQTQPSSRSYHLTPTTSFPLLPSSKTINPSSPRSTSMTSTSPSHILPPKPPSYDLYNHLHTKKYFLTPGLRFGCEYTVYPGDPLRFHSHFLAVHTEWNQEIDLMDLLGGGRLGTGVKKGFLFGGLEGGNRGFDEGLGLVEADSDKGFDKGLGLLQDSGRAMGIGIGGAVPGENGTDLDISDGKHADEIGDRSGNYNGIAEERKDLGPGILRGKVRTFSVEWAAM